MQGITSPVDDQERVHLSSEELQRGFRLACRAEVRGDLEVAVPQRAEEIILTKGEFPPLEFAPAVRKAFASPREETEKKTESDCGQLVNRLGPDAAPEATALPLPILRRVPGLVRNSSGFTAVFHRDHWLDLQEGDTRDRLFGVAFDIGTTTLVGYLWDLAGGEDVESCSCLNPQTNYGADVMTRIDYCRRQEDGLETLHDAIVGAMNDLIGELAERAGVQKDEIYEATVVGNTTMHHLFLGLDVEFLGVSPFSPTVINPLNIAARQAELNINPRGNVHLLPLVGGHLGADLVAAVLASGVTTRDTAGVRMVIDIGTNGEIVLCSDQEIVGCSTAAGPAFEGAHISKGMMARAGAVDHVWLDDDEVQYSVIGDAKVEGICGSGLVDAVAVLLRTGILNRKGRLEETPSPLASRLTVIDGETSFIIAPVEDCAQGEPLYITQNDIRQVQLAKGAIRAGVSILAEELGVTDKDIEEVYIAGAMGNFFYKQNAREIGLVPDIPLQNIKAIGNAAGVGAQRVLSSWEERKRARRLARQIRRVDLASQPDFNRKFVASVHF